MKGKKDKEDKTIAVSTPGEVLLDGTLFEQTIEGRYQIYDRPDNKFIVPKDNQNPWTVWQNNGITYFPLEKLPWHPAPCAYGYKDVDVLFNEVRAFFEDHLDISNEALFDVYAAFTLASWRPEDFNVVPYLFFLGPLASGKTRALECFSRLCYRAIMATSMTSASLFRASEAWHPTMILDETEIYNREGMAEIIALLNAGYRRGQYAWRVGKVESGRLQLQSFDVFGFKVLAGTQLLRATLSSRSIITSMSKNVRSVRLFIDEDKASELRGQLLRYRFQNLGKPLPEIDFSAFKDCRVAELFVSLLYIAPTEEIRERLREYAYSLVKSRMEEDLASLEARIFDAILKVEDHVDNGRVSTQMVTDKFNEGLAEKEQMNTRSVGRRVRALGFEKTRMTGGKAGFFWDTKRIERLKLRYYPILTETSLTSLTSKPTLMDVQHQNEVSGISEVIPERAVIQEAVEYAYSQMVKRLPDNTTGDMFLHDLKFKGLDKEEAENLLNKLTEEGPLGYDKEGWLVKI